MSNVSPDSSSSPKRIGYPYGVITKGIEVAEAIKGLGGNREEVPKSVIAKQLKLGENSGALQTQIAIAKAFGLIEGAGSFRLTEIGKKYFYPIAENDKQQSMLKMLVTPVVFEKLVDRFDGDKLPAPENLGNLLIEMGVPESWTQRAVSFFIGAAKYVGVLDDDGFLRHGAALHNTRINHEPSPESSDLPVAASGTAASAPASTGGKGQVAHASTPTSVNHVQGGVNVWVFGSKESSVRVETTKELSKLVWEKLNMYIQLLKPPEDTDTQ